MWLLQHDPVPTSNPSLGPAILATQVVQDRLNSAGINAIAIRSVANNTLSLIEAPETTTFEGLSNVTLQIPGFRALRPNRVGGVPILSADQHESDLPATSGQWILNVDEMTGPSYEQERIVKLYLDTLPSRPQLVMQLGRDGEFLITTGPLVARVELSSELQIIPGFSGVAANRLGWVATWFPNRATDADEVVSNQWIIRFDDIAGANNDNRRDRLQNRLANLGVEVKVSNRIGGNFAAITTTLPLAYETLHRQLSALPGYMGISPNSIVRAAKTPTDPEYGLQYGLNNSGQSIIVEGKSQAGTSDSDIDAPDAWDLTTGSATNIAAVIDSGIDLQHPDLMANLWVNSKEIPGNKVDDDGNGWVDDINGYNFIGSSTPGPIPLPPPPDDDDGHGTHVAGIIGARQNS